MIPWPYGREKRLMVIAPHPDDETLATGCLVQQAIGERASVLVVFMTNGENNPWPQRYIERRWTIGPAERKRWGLRRRAEALAALKELGLPLANTRFLDYPDQGLTPLLMRADDGPAERFAALIESWQPSLLVMPSPLDIHPDHSATAVYLRQALARRQAEPHRPAIFEFIVHTRDAAVGGASFTLPLCRELQDRKHLAIACHASQTRLRPRELAAFADREERFTFVPERPGLFAPSPPVVQFSQSGRRLFIELRMAACLGAFGRVTLCLAANQQGQALARLEIPLPHRSAGTRIAIQGMNHGGQAGEACFKGGPRSAELSMDSILPSGTDQLFIKIERQFGFFDEAGWIELPL